ncbi:plantaricin C family lantibiotic [Streptococcus suis]|uniref:Plantaricin C family lantibiotic n=1 Tax=Streptococcus suis TaxID=1307 RepID=A0A9Q5G7H7_STRSU|nr:plantaricin C family lantibiotic [Streptococcus suis]NQJ60634.1 plantaricin C family lantibiotic [Streptococcus suis]NQJ64868.1 plantaricin C family lantibiotic [Streptococcus suis]NQP70587.1 plantaricin C family lantibiotic [Streptococcus suis]NQP73033.1 plantaricin C family lantibiotic [Streptococcus suis]NQP79364.1 plantaricin C family lantibiotic [Streptococcus suis]
MSDWKKPIYESLSTEGNPAGDILRELSESEMDQAMAGGTARSYCGCYSGEHSCGRGCTITTECPFLTFICC